MRWLLWLMVGQTLLPSFIGLWSPRVGAGAVYAVHDRQGEVEGMEARVLSQVGEDYWIEVAYHGLDERCVRQLVGPAGTRQVVVEEGGVQRELVPGLWQGGGLPLPVAQLGQKVAQEKLQGFDCEVYVVEGARLWVSPQVSPFGLVRLVSRDLTLDLVKVVAPRH